MRILLVGACGRMGRQVAACAEMRGDEIVAGADPTLAPSPFPLYKDISEIEAPADAVVDFSSAQGLTARLRYVCERKLSLVLGTTGLSAEDVQRVEESAEHVPVLAAGNFSLGANLLALLAEQAASMLGDGFDIEIVERHHGGKKDAPSGTALLLKESAEAGRKRALEAVYGRHGMVGSRRREEIGIHSVRGGNVVGEHEIGFYGEDETVTLTHFVRDRRVFAVGALEAARWLAKQPAGLYSMRDLLKDR